MMDSKVYYELKHHLNYPTVSLAFNQETLDFDIVDNVSFSIDNERYYCTSFSEILNILVKHKKITLEDAMVLRLTF